MPSSRKKRSLRFPDTEDGVLYESAREGRLRLLVLFCFASGLLLVWFILRAPRAEWEGTSLGPELWWLFPTALVALSLALPGAMFYLHDRYVLRLEKDAAGGLRLVTFLVWGRRARELPGKSFADATVRHRADRYSSWIAVTIHEPSMRPESPRRLKLIFDTGRDSRRVGAVIDRLRRRS